MTSRTSNSSTSDFASAFRVLFSATASLEDWVDSVSNASTHYSSARSTLTSVYATVSGTPSETSRSQVTVRDDASQVTITGSTAGVVPPSVGGTSAKSRPDVKSSPPAYGGLEKDTEGEETRKQMLQRRRKECAVEEVNVALAPVLKINVPFCFYPEQYKRFREIFPRVNTDSGLAYVHHDHPVAHAATMVGIRNVQARLGPGQQVLDLHGNPNGNEQFNRFQQSRMRKRPNLPAPPHVDTLVEELTAADAVRKVTKWGNERDNDGNLRYIRGGLDDIVPESYDVFTSIHTLYYYSMYQVCALLAKNPKTVMHCLVNYSKEQSGTLYGELKFTKTGGMTTQYSPNGEKYSHPDIDQWFQTNSFRGYTQTVNSGISWTSTCIGGPLYIITITRCDWDLARTHRYDPPAAATLKVSGSRNFLGIVKIGGSNVQLNISNIDLASELRHFMTFRDRSNPQTFLDLCVKARRATGRDVVDGSRQHAVEDGHLQDHIVYAYLVDAPGELELMEGVKLLRGDLLSPLAEALKMQGKDNIDSLPRALFTWALGRKEPTDALGKRAIKQPRQPNHNSGGLIPAHRT